MAQALIDRWYNSQNADLIKAGELLEDACTPRPPRAAWFGDPDTEPGKWDAWWVEEVGTLRACYHARYQELATVEGTEECGKVVGFYLEGPNVAPACVPVSREGFPSVVGWGVVGVL